MKYNSAPLTHLASRTRAAFSFCILHSAFCIAFAALAAKATTIDPSNYNNAMTISPASGKVTSTLTGFPLLVRLSTARQPWFDPADCGTNGADLRFALADGTLLAHEIDTWNASGESVVWVNVPSLTASTEIVAYWGVKNASLAPAVTASDTWSDYVAVYHLGEGDRIAYDSSANGYSATNAAAVSLGANPPVGNCANIHDLYKTGVRDFLSAGATKPLDDRSRVTFSAWVAIDSFNTANNTYAQNARVELARKFSAASSDRHKGGVSCRYFANNGYPPKNSNPLFGIFMDDNTGNNNDVQNWNTTAPASDGTWLYLTCTVDGTTAAKYINGTAMSDSPKSFSHGILGPDVLPLEFGAADNSDNCQAYARMDEMRIRNGAVSAAWAAADYAQQTDGAFLSYGLAGDNAFAVSPIPVQIVVSAAEAQSGITPAVTVSNLTTSAELVPRTDYTVSFQNNTSVGTASALITGIGDYAGKSAYIEFAIAIGLRPSNYNHAMTITPTAGKVTATFGNFPLLVRLSTTRQPWFDPADCAAGGADLRFALEDNVLLPHEIDTWDASGESVVWVNVPSLSAETKIFAYWGVKDASQSPAVNAADAWPDYVAVYHLGEGGATAHDSSGNGYDAVNETASTVSAGTDPRIGGCVRITPPANGASYFKLAVTDFTDPTAAKPLDDVSAVTFSAWIAPDSNGGNSSCMPIMRWYAGWNDKKGGFDCRYFPAYPYFGLVLNSGGSSAPKSDFHNWNTAAPYTQGTWYYLTCTVNGATAAKYLNGALTPATGNPSTFSHGILPMTDPTFYQFGASLMNGRMDELRVRNGAVSAAWAAADYAQQADATFLSYAGVSDYELAISPIPEQVVISPDALAAGIEPPVTVSNLTTGAELVLGTDYTVSYQDNTAAGVASAIVTGIGDYAGYAASVGFVISSFTPYYIIAGNELEPLDHSSCSGDGGNPTGWAATRGSNTRVIKGITAAQSIYYVWTNRTVRTPMHKDFATPDTSRIVIEPSCEWVLIDKLWGNTLTLNNLTLGAGATLALTPNNDVDERNDTLAGDFTLADGATLRISASKDRDSARWQTFSANVTGRGAIFMPSTTTGYTYSGVLANRITGNITAFTGDIGTWNGDNAVSLELVNTVSLPGDPAPQDVAYVVVTNGATLIVSQDWTSPTNRIWILGDSGTPTINVPAGKTVTVNGNLVGSAGFNKTGAGTLVLRGASPAFSGTVTVSAGEVRLLGEAALLSGAARVTWVEDGGTYVVASLVVSPIPDQSVYDFATLAAGVRPAVTVSNLEDMVELVVGTDCTVAYSNNTAVGVATVVVTGVGDYAGMVRDVTFNIHLVKQITANYALSADEDWTDFESVAVASGVTIDLLGHNLTIFGLDGTGTITDSVGGGELRYYVLASYASGYKATITSVSLTGKLMLVKTGPGTLSAIKSGQTFMGGTKIVTGILKYACANDGRIDITHPFGYTSASDMGPVILEEGGILDPGGSAAWGNHTLIVNGGMVSNTVVARTNIDFGIFNPKTTVNADFIFATLETYGWTVPDIAGHTATVDIAIGKLLYVASSASWPVTGGCFNVVRGGNLTTFANRSADFHAADFDPFNAAFYLNGALSVRDYKATYPYNYGRGTGALNVHGTFTPESIYFYGPTMQDGSAIDLSANTGVWSAYSSLTQGGNRMTKFAADTTVAILLGERTPAMNERIVSWPTDQRPASTVLFTNDTYVLRVEDDGLYVDSPRTFNPSFLPDIASARLASDVEAAIEAALSVTNLVAGGTLALGTDYTYAYTIDHDVCTVTVAGLGDYADVSVVRTFSIGEIGFKESDYTYSMEIVPTVGKVTAPLTNFPVLVRLSESAIQGFHYERCNPDELRFALADGTLLAHEIDYWNEGGESTVWVNVPELTADTVIRAYWGFKPHREPLARPSDATWADYVGVWHFSEASGGARDSSVNRYHTSDGGGTVSNADARVGLARNVNMTSLNTGVSNLSSANNAKPLSVVSKFAVSGWMLSTLDVGVGSNAKYPQMMRNKNVWNDGMGWYTGIEGSSTVFGGTGSGNTRAFVTIPTIYNNWVYLTAVFDGAECSVYTNGAFVQTTPINTVKANTSYVLRFGQDLTGRIDEFRIQDGLQSAAYVSADYATQTDPDFLSYGRPRNTAPTMLLLR